MKEEIEGDQCSSARQTESFGLLMIRARNGDSVALGKLLERYRRYLLLIANEDISPAINQKVGASDVVQESMILAQQNFEQFRGDTESEFRGWLRVILRNDLKKQHRHYVARKRDVLRETELDPAAEQPGVSVRQPTPSQEFIRNELEESLFLAMNQLSEDHRAAIQYRNFDELSFEEVGLKMNRNSDAARKLWARGIEALQKILAREHSSVHLRREEEPYRKKGL